MDGGIPGQRTVEADLQDGLDEPMGNSESVEGSLPHTDEVADTETPGAGKAQGARTQLRAGKGRGTTSSEESEDNYWSVNVPRSWRIKSGRWRRDGATKESAKEGEMSPDPFFDFEDLENIESQQRIEDQSVQRYLLTPEVGCAGTADSAVQATATMREIGSQTNDQRDADGVEDAGVVLGDPDVYIQDGEYCKDLGPVDIAGDKKPNIMGSKDENGFVQVVHGCTSDSGAADTVGPEDLAEDYPLEESYGSKNNIHYVGAG